MVMYKIYYYKNDALYEIFLDKPNLELEEMLIQLDKLVNGSTEIRYWGIEI